MATTSPITIGSMLCVLLYVLCVCSMQLHSCHISINWVELSLSSRAQPHLTVSNRHIRDNGTRPHVITRPTVRSALHKRNSCLACNCPPTHIEINVLWSHVLPVRSILPVSRLGGHLSTFLRSRTHTHTPRTPDQCLFITRTPPKSLVVGCVCLKSKR